MEFVSFGVFSCTGGARQKTVLISRWPQTLKHILTSYCPILSVSPCVSVYTVHVCVLLPWLPCKSKRRDCARTADAVTGLKDSVVGDSKAQAFLAAVGQWTEVDVAHRCDLVPEEGQK